MVLRSAIRLVSVGLLALVLGVAFYWVTPGLGLANPAEVDRSDECGHVARSNVCGQVCFYGNCVECNKEEETVECNRCVVRQVQTTCREWVTWTICGKYDDNGYGDNCVEWVSGEGWSERDCEKWETVCRIDRTIFRDWHNAFPDDLPRTPTPWDDNPCGKVARGSLPSKVRVSSLDDDGPIHTRINYWRDGDTCVEWEWHVIGNSEEFEGRLIPVSRGNVSNLESALVIGSGRLPQYSCREDTGRRAGSTVVFATLGPVSSGGPLTGGSFSTEEGSSSFVRRTIVPGQQVGTGGYEIREEAADAGGPAISRLDTADSSGLIDVKFRLQGQPSGKQLYLRYWHYTGKAPGVGDVPFKAFTYRPGGVQTRLPARTLGVMSFQVAYKNSDGEFVKSGTVTGPVGFDWERISLHATSTSGVYPTPDTRLVALPTPTLLPTLTPGGDGNVGARPAAPGVRRIEDGSPAGRVSVVLRGGAYTGKLEYRYWPYAGHNRPADDEVGWRTVTLSGQSRFGVDLSSEVGEGGGYFVFEVRAVDARGDRSDPSPYHYRWVSGADPNKPTPTVRWINPDGVGVTPTPPALGTAVPATPAPVVVQPTAAP